MINPDINDLGRTVLHRTDAGILFVGIVDGYDDDSVFVRFGADVDTTAIARSFLNWPINGNETVHIVFG